MKKIYLSLILSCMSIIGFSQDWVKTNTGYNYIFKAMDFPGGQGNIGFAGGQDVTYMGDGIVIKTTNGGNTWTSLWTGTDQGIEGMSFPDLQTGYVCGWSGYFAKTANGGTSWTPQSPGADIYYYTDVAFKDANNGVVTAQTNSGTGVWITSNGGSSWTAGSGLTGVPYKLTYVSGNTYFLVTNGGDIQKSTDNGLTWTVAYDGGGLLLGIDFYDSNTGIAAGEDGRILKTYDGGATWQQQIIAYGNPLWHDFAWLDANNVIAAGTPETIWRSTDGGANWADDYPQSTYDPALYEALYINGTAYVIGSQGWFYKKAPLLTANFSASQTTICSGINVQFTDQSVGNPTSWSWTFEGGNPATSTLQNPLVNYPVPGVYDVTLTIYQGSNSNTFSSPDMIHVDGALTTAPIQPAGAVELCSATQSPYTTTALSGASAYSWSVSPSGAGTITGTGLTGTFTGSNTYTGAYAVNVRGVNACGQSPASEALNATLYHKPLEFSIYAGGGYCLGGPGVEIVLEDSEIGVDYQLYNYGVPVGSPVPGTGEQLSFGLQTEGVYSITATNAICTTEMIGLAEVFIILPPSAASQPTGPVTVCNSDVSTYSADFPQGSLSLAWTLEPAEAGTVEEVDYNTIDITWSPSFSGEAQLSVEGVNDCGSGTVSDPLVITIGGAPVPDISGDELSCINYTELYSVEEITGNTYNWTITGGSITQGQGTAEITVEWDAAGTAQIAVTETNGQGCEGTSETFDVTVMLCTSASQNTPDQVSIFPNPVNNALNIHFSQASQVPLTAKIYNSAGLLVAQKEITTGISDYTLDVSSFTKGMYYLRISGGFVFTAKFVK